jgi:hypothetical protein
LRRPFSGRRSEQVRHRRDVRRFAERLEAERILERSQK